MYTSYTIGMDIGGTNTDAVLVDQKSQLVTAVKVPTSANITSGFTEALQQLFNKSIVPPQAINALIVGTTHATNAILERQRLYKVGVLRIAGQDPLLPVCFGWPTALKQAIFAGAETIPGGFACHGKSIHAFSEQTTLDALEKLMEKGAESIAVIGVFSPMNPDHENRAAFLIKNKCPVSLSHALGSVGFIERENTTILNAALKKVMSEGFADLLSFKNNLGLTCPLYITQNNGSLITIEEAISNPILTISSGPTNSFIGASRLAQCQDAIVVDIGGTSTDIGMIKQGFAKKSLNTSQIGGVKLNFPMPDVLSIAIGGGSHTHLNAMGKVMIGPQSVGKNLLSQSMSFKGPHLTLTDLALKAGYLHIAGAELCHIPYSQSEAISILNQAMQSIEHEIKRMAGNRHELPIILVGGGASLFPKTAGNYDLIVPAHAHVANAYGAALAEVMGSIDQVVSLQARNAVLEELQQQAIDQAIHKGADPSTTQIVDIEIIPYHYVPNAMARVIMRVSGKRLL